MSAANRRSFSESFIKNARADGAAVVYWDTRTPGLGLRVAPGPAGRKSWLVMGRVRKQGRWVPAKVTLGTYPAIDIDAARQQSVEVRARFKSGDTTADLRAAQEKTAEDRSGRTVDWLVDEYIKQRKAAKKPPRSLPEIERQLRKDMLPAWRGRTIDSIPRRDAWELLDGIIAVGQEAKARLLLAAMRGMFAWAVAREYLAASPVSDIKLQAQPKKRKRTLTLDELRDVWACTSDTSDFSRIVRLLILTAQRRTEVGSMRGAEIDRANKLWCLPEERTKNGNAHDVHLTAEAFRIIDLRKTNLEFTFGRYDGRPFSGWTKAKRELDKAIQARRRDAADLLGEDLVPMPHWTLHDLRRTAATMMAEELRIMPHVIEAILNHVSGHKAGVAGVYNRASYAEQKREALEAWATFCADELK
jgi:integrase